MSPNACLHCPAGRPGICEAATLQRNLAGFDNVREYGISDNSSISRDETTIAHHSNSCGTPSDVYELFLAAPLRTSPLKATVEEDISLALSADRFMVEVVGVQQRMKWDCGVACTLMVLRTLCPRNGVNHPTPACHQVNHGAPACNGVTGADHPTLACHRVDHSGLTCHRANGTDEVNHPDDAFRPRVPQQLQASTSVQTAERGTEGPSAYLQDLVAGGGKGRPLDAPNPPLGASQPLPPLPRLQHCQYHPDEALWHGAAPAAALGVDEATTSRSGKGSLCDACSRVDGGQAPRAPSAPPGQPLSLPLPPGALSPHGLPEQHATALDALHSLVGTNSVWTIDLAFLLRRFGLHVCFLTTMLGPNPSFDQLSYYSRELAADVRRVQRLFQHAPCMGIPILKRAVHSAFLGEVLRRGGGLLLLILLVDKRKLRHSDEECAHPCSCCGSPSEYTGHYVVLCGHDSPTDTFFFLDPSFPRPPGCPHAIASKRLDEARRTFGTDEDILVVAPP